MTKEYRFYYQGCSVFVGKGSKVIRCPEEQQLFEARGMEWSFRYKVVVSLHGHFATPLNMKMWFFLILWVSSGEELSWLFLCFTVFTWEVNWVKILENMSILKHSKLNCSVTKWLCSETAGKRQSAEDQGMLSRTSSCSKQCWTKQGLVRALTCYLYGLGSVPRVEVIICELGSLLVLVLALRSFLWVLWFSSLLETNISKSQFDSESEGHWFISLRTIKSHPR